MTVKNSPATGKPDKKARLIEKALKYLTLHPEIQRVFSRKYTRPEDFLKGIPTSIRLKKATLVSYYLAFHPGIRPQRQWSNYVGAAKLRASGKEWELFFRKKYASPQALVNAIPPSASYSKATLVKYYFAFHPDKKAQRQYTTYADAAVLMESNKVWTGFFSRTYSGPLALIKAIPGAARQKKWTLMNYYLSLHPEIKGQRKWLNTVNAFGLKNSNKEWSRFFKKRYSGPHALIKAIPPSASQSKSTLVDSYLCLHPEIKTGRAWRNVAGAFVLAESGKAWVKFFKQKYPNPRALLGAIPSSASQSKATLVAYYLDFHSIIKDARQWRKAASAYELAESGGEWKRFFRRKYPNPQALLDAIPASANQSKATLMDYYLFLHSEIVKPRRWLDAASALVLAEADRKWARFFKKEYPDAQSLFKAAPSSPSLSKVTLAAYYQAFHPERKYSTVWNNVASGLIFYFNYEDAGRELLNRTLTAAEAKEKYNLSQKAKTITAYIRALRNSGFNAENIEAFRG